jgi:amidase
VLDAEAAFAGIAGQVELMRRGDASARDLADLALARIAALDPQINAFGAVHADRALTEADEADRRRTAGEDGPLLGVPIAVKDEIDIGGHVTSRGTDAFTVPAPADAEVVRRLRAA